MGASARSETREESRPATGPKSRKAAASNEEEIAMDFGALPPEVNSGRMYAGSGAGPMLAAAAAWDGSATEFNSAAAYEAAFAATVAPPVIAENRALLMSLVATNILGQNTPAIAATEAHYAEMWAQDATAMYGYAGASAAASTFSPFTVRRVASDAMGLHPRRR